MGIFSKLRGFFGNEQDLNKRMANAVDFVKIGLYLHIHTTYKMEYGKEYAGMLAAAVTNELFLDDPSNERGKEFLEKPANKSKVIDAIKALTKNEEIRKIITEAIRVKATVIFGEKGKDDPLVEKIIVHIKKLKDIGILIPGGDFPEPSTFIPMATEFLATSKKRAEGVAE